MEATLVQNNLVARKAVDFRVHSLPAVPPALAALFPEMAIGAPLSRCGAQMLYGAQVRSSGADCLLLIVEASSFRDDRHRQHFLAGLPQVQAIQHPHLLKLLWMGERGGNVCLGYEGFAGECLFPVMDRFLMDPPTVVSITAALGGALEAAHVHGVIHRDLNPSWILMDATGGIKLAGMGIAALLHGPDDEFSSVLLWRPEYLRSYPAPEQLNPAEASDHQADIHALGMITYELLTGAPPGGYVGLPSARAAVGTHVDQVIFRALHSSRPARYQSAAEFARDVQLLYAAHRNQYLQQGPARESQGGGPAPRQKKRLLPWLIAGAVLAVIAASGWWYLHPEAKARAMADDAESEEHMKELTAALSKSRPGMSKDQKEAIMAVTGNLMRLMMESAMGSRKQDRGTAAAWLFMQAGLEDMALEEMLKLQWEAPPDSVDWRRIEALIQLMRGGRDGYAPALAAADQARLANDRKRERAALARAAGFIPNHVGLAERERQNGYDPVPELEAILRGLPGGPVKYAIRARGLILELDLANNKKLTDLSALAGFPITHLDLSGTGVMDLSAFRRMPLHSLLVDHSPVHRLAPLAGGCLGLLTAEGCRIADPERLDDCPVLADYRLTAADGTLLTKSGSPSWDRPWVNSLGMPIRPTAYRSAVLISSWETRVQDFQRFAREHPTPDDHGMIVQTLSGKWERSKATWRQASLPKNQTDPVVGITWQEAADFCAWLTASEQQQRILPGRAAYRLVRSREWNQAAGHFSVPLRGSSPLVTSGPPFIYRGNQPPSWQLPSARALAGLRWTRPAPAPAGTFRTLFGIADLGNHVREWSSDLPTGTGAPPGVHLVRDLSRSGSPPPGRLPTAAGQAEDLTRWEDLGFRIALELPPVHVLAE